MKTPFWLANLRALFAAPNARPRRSDHRLAVLGRGCVEPLEDRITPALTAADAGFFPVLSMPASVPADLVGRVDEGYWSVVAQQTGAARGTPAATAPGFVQLGRSKVNAGGAVETAIHLTRWDESVVDAVRRLGATVSAIDRLSNLIEAWVPPASAAAVATLPGVARLAPPGYGSTNQGSVTTAADGILRTDKARAQFAALGIDGTGVKVGVISNGVSNRGLVTGSPNFDLPGVTVNPALPGSGDEGTAMLEIVHDLAPGAQLFFSSGTGTDSQFIESVIYLAAQGCKVIVDDISRYAQPYFADGPVAKTVQAVIDTGVVYLTSAGNDEGRHYQAPFNDPDVDSFHDFASGGNEELLNVTVPAGTPANPNFYQIYLQWSEPFGGATSNYDLFLFDSSLNIIASSTTVQNGTNDPIEVIFGSNTGAAFTANIVFQLVSGSPARELEMFERGFTNIQFTTSGDNLIAQEAVADVLSIGAVNAGDPGNDTVASNSSRGTSTIYTDFATQTKIQRQTLDGLGIDGTQSKIGQLGFFVNPFFGTSAAAPHVAGIVALMRQVNSGKAPDEIALGLDSTATDLGAPGYDPVAGAGLYNGLDAVFYWYQPPAADLSAVSDDGTFNGDNITSVTTPTFQGSVPAGSFVRILANGTLVGSKQLGPTETAYSITTSALAVGKNAVTVITSSSAAVSQAKSSDPSSPLNVEIVAPSPFVVTGNTLNVTGTDKNDVFEFVAGAFLVAMLNGSAFVAPPQVTVVALFGRDGNDSVRIQGRSGSAETLFAFSGSATVSGGGYDLLTSMLEDLIMIGSAEDKAMLFDSAGNDLFVGTPDYASLSNTVFAGLAIGFGQVTANGNSGGVDTAYLYDSAKDDVYVGTTEFGYVSNSSGYLRSTVGFESVTAYATAGGNDQAFVYDSKGDDTAIENAFFAYVTGPGGYLRSSVAFESATFYATEGGVDSVFFFDTQGNDAFVGTPAFAYMVGPGSFRSSIGFERATAFSTSGGQDEAYLYDSAGDDVFVGTQDFGYIIGPNSYLRSSIGFGRVFAYADAGGKDSATLFDTAGNDAFVGTPDFSYMIGSGLSRVTVGFEDVTAMATGGGNDQAFLFDSKGNDTFVGFGNTGKLSGSLSGKSYSFTSVAFDFVQVDGTAGGPNSKAITPPLSYVVQFVGVFV